MKHGIEILEKESEKLKKYLSEWDLNNDPEARKLTLDKLKSLETSISYLKNAESFNNAVEGKTL